MKEPAASPKFCLWVQAQAHTGTHIHTQRKEVRRRRVNAKRFGARARRRRSSCVPLCHEGASSKPQVLSVGAGAGAGRRTLTRAVAHLSTTRVLPDAVFSTCTGFPFVVLSSFTAATAAARVDQRPNRCSGHGGRAGSDADPESEPLLITCACGSGERVG